MTDITGSEAALQLYWDELMERQRLERERVWPLIEALGGLSRRAETLLTDLEASLSRLSAPSPTGESSPIMPRPPSRPAHAPATDDVLDELTDALRREVQAAQPQAINDGRYATPPPVTSPQSRWG